MRRTNMETNQHRQGEPVESLRLMQVHSGASSTASAPTDTLFVGRVVSVVTRPPALLSGGNGNSGIEPFGTGGDTHTEPYSARSPLAK